jgi:uncharacterized protein (DUF1697 family)
MALVVFLRGVNVGGHRRFRPSVIAKELSRFDVVNIGATGLFVVRKPGSTATFRAALMKKLPFETDVVICEGRDIARLAADDPFASEPVRADVARFVSVLPRSPRVRPATPITLPPEGEWFVKVLSSKGRFVFGVYRRHMKTIGYLGKIDKLFGMPVTTRNWNTMLSIIELLKT